jgi:regulatory protein
MPSARLVALKLLGRRDYTTAEIRQKLLDREFSAEDVDAAVDGLIADRLLDDRRTAAAHLRTASRVKGRGRLRIQQELQARGVDRGLVREVLAGLPAADETTAIETFLRRRRLPDTLTMADRRRVFQQLLRRGFTSDVIAKALKNRDRT